MRDGLHSFGTAVRADGADGFLTLFPVAGADPDFDQLMGIQRNGHLVENAIGQAVLKQIMQLQKPELLVFLNLLLKS